ncbi:hypothetical protein [Nesterenkonia flava]|uniref:Uncharacterized protein n=1 Tax=Nesterenkonia flava TaxID=469799 RepID=A0ABU1FU51_9MICC|nr:hypothetical protein [Nesterenkonia flava]MDR5712184.1 hypothetical protein [Nesterenkonia flava]
MSSHEQHRQVTVRSTPKLVPFLVAAVAVAFTAAVVVVYSTAPAQDYSRGSSLGYLTFVFAFPSLAIFATLWLLLEKRSRTKAQRRTIERIERGTAS